MRYIITGLFFLLSSFFIVGVGPTEAAAPVFEITPLVGYSIGGGFGEASTGQSLGLDEGAHYGLSRGLKFDEQSLVEVFYSHQAIRRRLLSLMQMCLALTNSTSTSITSILLVLT